MPGSSRRDNNSGSTSTGTSSTTPSKYYMNKLWTCCKCNDNAAMDFAATEYCAGFHCGHHRCKRCPIEFHKRLIKEPDFRRKYHYFATYCNTPNHRPLTPRSQCREMMAGRTVVTSEVRAEAFKRWLIFLFSRTCSGLGSESLSLQPTLFLRLHFIRLL
ncbi:hypothetical protein BKA61DRAFT_260766 [Leptodontidium sp. MPI-SDFR-AT-0119]|nr:hypothetical protein BKA61DRAFT_260766 [Leptodontidium sp. MPI-SDFR-AT-0119]